MNTRQVPIYCFDQLIKQRTHYTSSKQMTLQQDLDTFLFHDNVFVRNKQNDTVDICFTYTSSPKIHNILSFTMNDKNIPFSFKNTGTELIIKLIRTDIIEITSCDILFELGDTVHMMHII